MFGRHAERCANRINKEKEEEKKKTEKSVWKYELCANVNGISLDI